MAWPSTRVPQGGIFQPAKVRYSPETRDFLKVLLDESKLSSLQRQKVNYSLRSGEPLPSLQSKSASNMSSKSPKLLVRPGSSKKRSQNTIISSGAYIREKFVPQHPKVDRDKAKKHLQDFMAFGKDIAPTPRKPKLKPKEVNVAELEEYNRFDQLLEEIKEREEFLKEMEELGEGSKYKIIIEQQIQAKLREMEKLKLEGDISTHPKKLI